MMLPFVLPNVFVISEKSSKDEYMQIIFPELKKVFGVMKPIQVSVCSILFINKILFIIFYK